MSCRWCALRFALDTLSEYYDEGTNAIMNNCKIERDDDLAAWEARWVAWQKKVEDHIEATLGLAEKNIFRNRVLLPDIKFHDSFDEKHNHARCCVASQLLHIRETIIRHGATLS